MKIEIEKTLNQMDATTVARVVKLCAGYSTLLEADRELNRERIPHYFGGNHIAIHNADASGELYPNRLCLITE